MSGIFVFMMLALASTVLPLLELLLNIIITALVVGGVLYLLGKWVWDEYQISREAKQSMKENSHVNY